MGVCMNDDIETVDDTINRLQAEVERLVEDRNRWQVHDIELQRENERLRAALTDREEMLRQENEERIEEVTAAEAEVERVRKEGGRNIKARIDARNERDRLRAENERLRAIEKAAMEVAARAWPSLPAAVADLRNALARGEERIRELRSGPGFPR
jgi:FtsZ-binding cell division protein ZapB